MKFINTIILVVGLIFLSVSAQAKKKAPAVKIAVPAVPKVETPPGLQLKEALKKGLEYSPDLKKADAAVKEAEANVSKTRAFIFPTVNAVGTAVSKQNSTTYTVATSTATVGAVGDTYTAGLTLSQPLYVGGGFTSGLNLAKSSAEFARQNYFTSKQNTIVQILAAFYSLSEAQKNLEAANQNRDILKSYVGITAHYERIGRSRKMDKMQAAVNYSLSLADVESISNKLKQSQSALKLFLGITNDAPILVDHTVVITPIEKISLEEAFKAAKENNSFIRTKKIALEQVEYSKDVDLATDFPSLYLNGGLGYQAPDRATLFNNTSQTYNVGLTLTVPIFSGLSSLAKRSIYGQKEYQAQYDLQMAENNLRADLEDNLNNIHSYKVQLVLAQGSVKEGQDALDLANKGYQQGLASSLDVVNLQKTRYDAEKLLVTTQYNYLKALVNLRNFMGIDLEKAYAQ